jgi:hypothetical protein
MPSSTPLNRHLAFPHTAGCLFVLFVPELLCLVYLGFTLPFLWEFVTSEARVGDLMKNEEACDR